jgi:hypothetical protein
MMAVECRLLSLANAPVSTNQTVAQATRSHSLIATAGRSDGDNLLRLRLE